MRCWLVVRCWILFACLVWVTAAELGCNPRVAVQERATSRSPEGAFFFVQMTDTHWGALDGVAMTRRAVEKINALPVKVEFVALTGDLFADSIGRQDVVEEGLAAMKDLKVPVYYVPGNHDLIKDDYSRDSALFRSRFGPLDRRVDVCGVACLFVNTEATLDARGGPADRVREWIEQALPASNGPSLIFMHRPPVYDMQFGKEDHSAWDRNYDSRWEEFMGRHPGIQAICCGHFHRDELAWIGSVPVYVESSMARFWERQPSFRLYRYHAGRLNYWTFYLEHPRKS